MRLVDFTILTLSTFIVIMIGVVLAAPPGGSLLDFQEQRCRLYYGAGREPASDACRVSVADSFGSAL